MVNVVYYFIYFFIYALLGYLFEIICCYLKNKRFINKGFLHGPYLPIYGVIGLTDYFLLSGYYNDCLVVLVFGIIFGIIILYITSVLLEKSFKNKFWDYSYYKYHINGRVCLKQAMFIGTLTLISFYLINPLIFKLINIIPKSISYYIFFSLSFILLIDYFLSMFEAYRVCNIVDHLDLILSEYTKKRNIKLNKIKTRLLDAYPYLINYNEREISRLKKLKKDFSKYKNLH